MSIETDRIEAISFDSFSTLVDVESSREVLEEYTDEPLEVAQTWRSRALFYSTIADDLEQYETYYELHRLGLEYAAEHHGLDLTSEEIEQLNQVYYDLEPFDDVLPVFEQLRDCGYDLYVISNGDPKMLNEMIDSLDVEELLSDTFSADAIEVFKPAAEIYEYASQQTGTPIERMAHVSAAVFDAQGAKHAGMKGIWINRKRLPQDPYGPSPDLVIESLHDLVDELNVE